MAKNIIVYVTKRTKNVSDSYWIQITNYYEMMDGNWQKLPGRLRDT